ncbi:MAG: hypothetical protein RL748_4195 [Pseudomonadota bacterium]|jgi:flagellar biosynthesis chaperone FliJ
MSRRFHYTLQPVLLERQWELDAACQELARINQLIASGEQALQNLQQEQASVSSAWQQESAQAQGLQRDRFELVTRYMAQLAGQYQQQQSSLQQYRNERDGLIERVGQARRALDAVEEHRDLSKVKFTRQQLSADGKIADDQWSMAQTRGETEHE